MKLFIILSGLLLYTSLCSAQQYFGNMHLVETNKISIPINNSGVLADVSINGIEDGRFNNIIFLFSGGFGLSGYSGNTMWANGVMSSHRIEDYIPGPVGSNPLSYNHKIYTASITDAFGESWEEWKKAVELGADFYDGDNDGIYNPVDKNGNGKWDPEEDCPDFIGSKIAWCIYNDGVPASLRRFNDVAPQGIEIQQTVFTFDSYPITDHVIFIRYRIFNRNQNFEMLDSVYFGIWSDPVLETIQMI